MSFLFHKNQSKTIRTFTFFTSFSFLSLILHSQDIVGRWQGKSYWPGPEEDTIHVYLEIKRDSANWVTGFSVSVSEEFYGKASLNGYWDKKSDKYILYESGLIEMYKKSKRNFILNKYALSFQNKDSTNLTGIIECETKRKIDKISWYCSERSIVFYKTRDSMPPTMKKKSERILFLRTNRQAR